MNRKDPHFVFVPPRGHEVKDVVLQNEPFLADRLARDRHLLTKDGFEKLRLGYYDIVVPPPKPTDSELAYNLLSAFYRTIIWYDIINKLKKAAPKYWEPEDSHQFHCEKYLPKSCFQYKTKNSGM